MPTSNKNKRIEDEGENYPILERPREKDHPQQLTTINVFTYNVEDPKWTEKKKSITRLFAMHYFWKDKKDVAEKQEKRMNNYISTSISSKKSKRGHEMDCPLKKNLWYGTENMNNREPKSLQNIR